MTPKHSFSLQTPGKTGKFRRLHDDLLCKGRATRGRTWWRGSRGTQRGAMTSMGSPGVVVKTDSSDGFPLQGVGDTSAAFGMCINNYWKIVIVSCKKTWPWMIYVTSSESEGISMPYLYIVFMIPQWPSCIFYLFGTLSNCYIAPFVVTFQLPFGWKKRSKIIPCGRCFFWLVHGVGGEFGCKPGWTWWFFDPISFDSVKGFLWKPTVKSALETSEWRADGSVAGISIQLLELLAIWRASAMGGLPDHQPKVVQNHPLWFFSFQSHGHFFNLTLLSKKRVTHDSQMVPEKNHHQTSATFKGDFRISSRVFSSHSSVRDFPVLGCSRYGS